MISAFANTWKVPELRDRILFTLGLIIIIRFGVHLTLPGVDATVIQDWLKMRLASEGPNPAAAVGAMLTVFSGGGLEKCGLFALGIMPYISASIMIQLMTAVVPTLAKLSREDGGRQKITQYTRILTIIIAVVQGFMLTQTLKNPGQIFIFSGIEKVGRALVPDPSNYWVFMTVMTIVAGTVFLMWLGDQLTERGLGNGISLIIAVNIISAFPGALIQTWKRYVVGNESGSDQYFSALILVGLIAFLLFVIAAVVSITQAQRRIAIHYAKRVVGRKQFGGQTQYLPLKVNYAGVMPIIFASAVLALPALLLNMLWKDSTSQKIQEAVSPGSPYYYVIAGTMIFFFSYFWVATMFNPSQVSEDLKRSGGYIPGVRPGKPTAEFLNFTMSRLTFAGSIFLTMVFVLPMTLSLWQNLPALVTQFFGGTSLLIMVGVLLDMMRQVETHLLERHYDGFLRKGKIKGRYDRMQTGRTASGSAIIYIWLFAAAMILVAVAAMYMRP
jgi:preprotein translocase subunit SecY